MNYYSKKQRGANAIYLEPYHRDIFDFIESKTKPEGYEIAKCKEMIKEIFDDPCISEQLIKEVFDDRCMPDQLLNRTPEQLIKEFFITNLYQKT